MVRHARESPELRFEVIMNEGPQRLVTSLARQIGVALFDRAMRPEMWCALQRGSSLSGLSSQRCQEEMELDCHM